MAPSNFAIRKQSPSNSKWLSEISIVGKFVSNRKLALFKFREPYKSGSARVPFSSAWPVRTPLILLISAKAPPKPLTSKPLQWKEPRTGAFWSNTFSPWLKRFQFNAKGISPVPRISPRGVARRIFFTSRASALKIRSPYKSKGRETSLLSTLQGWNSSSDKETSAPSSSRLALRSGSPNVPLPSKWSEPNRCLTSSCNPLLL